MYQKNLNEKLVIFDNDGTLYKTESVSVEAIQKAFQDLNLPKPSAQKILSLVGETMDRFCEKILPGKFPYVYDNLAERIRYHERVLIPKKAELYDNIDKVLKKLIREGFTLAICSNASVSYINLVLNTLGILNLFKYIKGKELPKTKTDLIKDILTESNHSFAIVVGDTVHDINAAHSNKLPCIGVKYGYGGEQVRNANFIAKTPEEIVGHVIRGNIFSQIEKDTVSLKIKGPTIVGINGVDTSGKTQFSILLSKYLQSRGYKTSLIHLDDFHNHRRIRYQGENEIDSYINNAFNLKLLKEELLYPAKRDKLVDKELTLLDLESDFFTNKKHFHIDNQTIVILEGTLLYREPIDEYFDYRIYLDIEFEEVLRRAGQRDEARFGKEILEKYKNKYIPIQKRYIEKYLPKKRSNLVIDNRDYNHPMVK